MSIERRNTEKDVTWNRAWTADLISDLSSIPGKHGDIAFCLEDGKYYSYRDNDTWFIDSTGGGGGGGAPTDAGYITKTPNTELSNEQALSQLGTGLVKNTTGTGVLSIAAEGTDYVGIGDSRLSDARAPLDHATEHITGGGDIIPNAIAGGNAGLLSGTDKTKLDGIASGAEVNVNPDWNSASGDSQILNKPSTFTPSIHAINHKSGGSDVIKLSELAAPDDNTILDATISLHGLMGKADKSKLDGIAVGAEVNVNADWNAVSGDAQILNKPSIGSPQSIGNGNTANVVANAADTYLTGSSLAIGGRLKAGTYLRWRFSMTKTAAGVVAPTFNVRFGLNGTVADTSRILFTLPVQTAAVDTGYACIDCIVRSIGASGVVQGVLSFEHINTTTGLTNVAQIRILQTLSAGFDTTPGGLIVGVSCNPGSAGVWTFQIVNAIAENLN